MAELNWGLLRQPDYFGNALQAYRQGQEMRQGRDQRNALAMYRTNPQGAVDALIQAGDLPTALAIQGQQRQAVADQRDAAMREGRKTIAGLLQAGNLDGALQASIENQDTEMFNVVSTLQKRYDDQNGFTPTEFKNPDGSTTIRYIPKRPPVGGQQAPQAAPQASSPQPKAAQPGGFDRFYSGYLGPVEGGYAPSDGNGKPVNFGINQGANPDLNVANLTPEQAKQITYERYWKPSGADNLPAGLAEVHADTAFNMGLGTAQRLLTQSGGDPQRYLTLREQRYREIAARDPSKGRFLPTWLDRNQKLGQFVSAQAPQAQAAQQQQDGGLYTIPGDAAPLPSKKELLDMQNVQSQIDERTRKAQDDIAGKAQAENTAQSMAAGKAQAVLTNVNKAVAAINADKGVTGLKGQIGKNFGGTKAYDLKATINTIKANLAFDTLQEMRKASPTGGALGAVSERELALLESALAALDQGQSSQQLLSNLEAVRSHYMAWAKTVGPQGGKMGQDGNWYVPDPAKPGSFPRADLDPNGVWRVSQSGQPPQVAVDALRRDPRLAGQFDAKYGQGAARKVLGK